jgi:hypothetical protein
MKSKSMINMSLLCGLVMSAVAGATGVALNSDPFALNGQQGLVSVSYTQGSYLYFYDVAYAVYDAAVFSAHNGFDPSNGQNKYIYAYQIFNSVGSNTNIKLFSIDILDGVAINNITYSQTPGISSGVIPHLTKELHGSVTWKFNNNPITPGEHSAVVLFTTNFSPAAGGAISHAGNIDGFSGLSVATPSLTTVPEPATLVILGLGSLILYKRRPKASAV